MSTLLFTLSTKVDKGSGLSEVLIRFFAGDRFSLRAKSKIFVNAIYWDAKKQTVVNPNLRFKNISQRKLSDELRSQARQLSMLRQYIESAFMEVEDGHIALPNDWLKNVVDAFHTNPSALTAAKPAPKPASPNPAPKPQPRKSAAPKPKNENVAVRITLVEEQPASEPAPEPVIPVQEPAPSSTPFFSVFDDFIAKNPISDNRKRHYHVVYRALQRYEAYNKTTLSFDNITAETLKDFERYLENEHVLFENHKLTSILKMYPESRAIHQRGGNYIKDMMGKLRTFCRYASGKIKEMPVNEPFFKTNPFDAYSIGTQTAPGTPYFLTIEERNHLYHFELNSERLSRQRDIFVFQCLIGCRVGDLMRLTWDNVIGDQLHYIPAKTCKNNPKTIIIPLHSMALEIINKYKTPGRKMLLPFVAQQQYNDDIKAMLTLAGITRKVVVVDPKTGHEVVRNINDIASSHMARRTFVGNLYNKVKDPDLIGSLSGHVEGSKAFARYRAIDMKVKKELVSMLDDAKGGEL